MNEIKTQKFHLQVKAIKNYINKFKPTAYFTKFDLQVQFNDYAFNILGKKNHDKLIQEIDLFYHPQAEPLISHNELLFAKFVLEETVCVNEPSVKVRAKKFTFTSLIQPDKQI
ncbi:MAG: hypothetical protein L0Y77_05750 [Chlorobi bacterium]|nr:hypothetical protein [Chlorobiota bacterium]